MDSKSKNIESWETPAWIESIVSLMETSEAPPPWDHESWVGRLARPEWVRRMEEEYLGSWERFPSCAKEATPRKLGLKLGKDFGENFLGVTLFEDDPNILTKMLRKFMPLVEPGFEMSDEDANDLIETIKEHNPARVEEFRELAERIFRIVFRQRFEDIAEFLTGFSSGFSTWVGVDPEDTSENDRRMAARILFDRWETADKLTNRREVADLVFENLPANRKNFLAANEVGLKAFRENIGKMCGVIGLTDAPRGRKKDGPDSE